MIKNNLICQGFHLIVLLFVMEKHSPITFSWMRTKLTFDCGSKKLAKKMEQAAIHPVPPSSMFRPNQRQVLNTIIMPFDHHVF